MMGSSQVVAVIPCNDLDVSRAFYGKLGFRRVSDQVWPDYEILSDGRDGDIHLTRPPEGWLAPAANPFGIFIYTDNADELAKAVGERLLHPLKRKPWGTLEFVVSDPDGTLVRVGQAQVGRENAGADTTLQFAAERKVP